MYTRPRELKTWESPFLDTLSSVLRFPAHGDIHGYVAQDQTPKQLLLATVLLGFDNLRRQAGEGGIVSQYPFGHP